ncbi:MAG: hypothetical protein HY791_20525 [Deltaproteobacteria bacterium]|nr:hypothetical protein [Deltaproteobacteria bacterium]
MVNGSFQIGRIRGAPILLHWSLLFGVVLICFWFGAIRPVSWVLFFGLVLIHELGHAVLVWRNGLTVEHVRLHALGGECAYSGFATPWQHSVVSWGGVLAQLAVLAVVYPFQAEVLALPFGEELLFILVRLNSSMIVLNLMPLPPLDGAKALPLFSMAYARFKKRRRSKAAEPKPEAPAPLPPDPELDEEPDLPRNADNLYPMPPDLDLSGDDLSDDDPELLKKLVRGIDYSRSKK